MILLGVADEGRGMWVGILWGEVVWRDGADGDGRGGGGGGGGVGTRSTCDDSTAVDAVGGVV